MNPTLAPERSRETKERLSDNSSNILLELSKLVKQSNKNSSSQEVSLYYIHHLSIIISMSINLFTITLFLHNDYSRYSFVGRTGSSLIMTDWIHPLLRRSSIYWLLDYLSLDKCCVKIILIHFSCY